MAFPHLLATPAYATRTDDKRASTARQRLSQNVRADRFAVIEAVDVFSENQKREIFYNDAARLLKLGAKQVAQHHE
ncbi:hypothetical protein MNKW57_05740 [Biformimicrobium ophioploci]|uniref:Uncharacterized protein n=1 Tax=Biformimicrobium ophioploci TaxID=3036711 RepID=A0ABQ6LVY8_9GAMM|nr:hypothetical protein MNKW57_05740 [Microbulbifer sp. NKW57]